MLVGEWRVVSGCPGLPLPDRLFWPVADPASSAYVALRDHRFSVNLGLTLRPSSRPPACKVHSSCRLRSLAWYSASSLSASVGHCPASLWSGVVVKLCTTYRLQGRFADCGQLPRFCSAPVRLSSWCCSMSVVSGLFWHGYGTPTVKLRTGLRLVESPD
jgi:hypothetical protein